MGNGVTKAANTLAEIIRSRENPERAAQLEHAVAAGPLVRTILFVVCCFCLLLLLLLLLLFFSLALLQLLLQLLLLPLLCLFFSSSAPCPEFLTTETSEQAICFSFQLG